MEALRGINFEVKEGEIFGLLGPNGAGKTTTIKILTTMLTPTSGEVRIIDLDPVKEYQKLRPMINFILGGERNLYWRLSAYDNLSYFADLYKVPSRMKRKKIEELLELVGLSEVGHRRVETFSKGMKQKLQIARGLINQPKILFLDEPTIGLDPMSARQLRTILKDLQQRGTTILLTTHYMYEADELCDRIAFIRKGEITALDTPNRLKQMIEQVSIVQCTISNMSGTDQQRIKSIPSTTHLQIEQGEYNHRVRIQTHSPQEVILYIYQNLFDGVVSDVSISTPTLEDVYVKLIGSDHA